MYRHDRSEPFRVAAAKLGLEDNVRRCQARSLNDLQPVREKIQDWMRVFGYPRKDIFAVTLAVHEAMTNAVRHGNRCDPSKHVQVSFLVTLTEVLVEVVDQGRGFDPNHVPDPFTDENLGRPSGRGLFLMRAYTSWVTFNQDGNQVTLCKQRSDVQ
jgi:serine/threonine-protein kinase RsbW